MALIKTVFEEEKSHSNLQGVSGEGKLSGKPFYWGWEFEPLLENVCIIHDPLGRATWTSDYQNSPQIPKD